MSPDLELELLPREDSAPGRKRLEIALAVSVVLHVVFIALLPYVPAGPVPDYSRQIHLVDLGHATPLIEPVLPPPTKLTQKEVNKGKTSTEVSMADLMPKLAVPPRSERAAIPRRLDSLPGASTPAAPKPIEAPKIDTTTTDISKLSEPPGPGIPQIQPVEKPKLAFERVGAPGTSPVAAAPGAPKVELPKTSVEDAVRSLGRGAGRGGLVIGDAPEGSPGVSEVLGQAPASGASRSTVELLSDPQGVDFRGYLIQVLSAVRRNWKAVMPESARFGRRGLTVLQFSISRSGSVPKLVIAGASGTEALDRAAVAGVSASNPFPPLPPEFKGNEIRLELRFSYNMPAR